MLISPLLIQQWYLCSLYINYIFFIKGLQANHSSRYVSIQTSLQFVADMYNGFHQYLVMGSYIKVSTGCYGSAVCLLTVAGVLEVTQSTPSLHVNFRKAQYSVLCISVP